MPNSLKPNKEVSLSNKIRFDKTIPHGAKILFAEFQEWSKERASFPFDANTLAEMYDVTPATIRKWVEILHNHRLIDLYIDFYDGCQKKFIKVLADE